MSDITLGRARAGWRDRLGAAGTASAGLDTRRTLQLGLAAIWLLDGVLQYQLFMFTKAFGQMIRGPRRATLASSPARSTGTPPWFSTTWCW